MTARSTTPIPPPRYGPPFRRTAGSTSGRWSSSAAGGATFGRQRDGISRPTRSRLVVEHGLVLHDHLRPAGTASSKTDRFRIVVAGPGLQTEWRERYQSRHHMTEVHR